MIVTLILRGVEFGDGAGGFLALTAIALPLSIVAGALSYHFVERPAMERMKRWQPRRRAVAPAAATLLLVLAALAVAAPRGPQALYYEVRMPAGTPRGVTLLFHPGAWCGASPPGARECGPPENRLRDDPFDGQYASAAEGRAFADMERAARAAGQITVASTYTTDAAGLGDVLATYDQAHARWPDLPISAWGSSAGAHWALMLGANRRLHAVVGEGTPADFAVWKTDVSAIFDPPEAYDPARFYPTSPPTPGAADRAPRRPDGGRAPVARVRGEGGRPAVRPRSGLGAVGARPGRPRPARAGPRRGPAARAVSLVAVIAAAVFASPGVVQTCADAPAGAGLAATGHFAEASSPGFDVSENGCAPAVPRATYGLNPGVTDGLQLRVVPGPPGATVRRGDGATATLTGPLAAYRATFAAYRADPGYAFALSADGQVLWSTGDPPPKTFAVPPGTRRLTWSLTCRAARCPAAATGDPAHRGLPAALNVYGSTAIMSGP